MAYSSSLDAEWEILEPLLLQILAQKKRTRACDWRAANRWHPLSTQEWLQLGKLAQTLPTQRLLALTIASIRVIEQLMSTLHGQVRIEGVGIPDDVENQV